MPNAIAATLHNLSFLSEELDYETNAGLPIWQESSEAPAVLDSYLMVDGVEKKLYRPSPATTKQQWKIGLIIEREKLKQIQALIKDQMQITKRFRKSFDVNLLAGFLFKSGIYEEKVWINQLSVSSSFYEKSSKKYRCSLSLIEVE